MTDWSEICAGGEFRIAADGTWFHDGTPIRRESLRRLLATVLRRDAAGDYWLQTPAEKVPVEVDDAPFRIVDLHSDGAGRTALLEMVTDVGATVPLDEAHPLILRQGRHGPRPYVALDGGLEALVSRPVWYRLCAMAAEGPGGPGIWSGSRFFLLDPGLPGNGWAGTAAP